MPAELFGLGERLESKRIKQIGMALDWLLNMDA